MGNVQRKTQNDLGTMANHHPAQENAHPKKPPEITVTKASPPELTNLLTEEGLAGKHPLEVFKTWMMEAFQNGEQDPFLMNLATATSSGAPSVRMVALGDVDERGFYFGTVEGSRKVGELKENPRAAVSFYWPKLQRTIRVEGNTEQCENKTAAFKKWPKPFQVAMLFANHQGPAEDFESLNEQYRADLVKFADKELEQPDFVVTYVIMPTSVQFMQSKEAGLSDRFVFSKKNEEDQDWTVQRIYP